MLNCEVDFNDIRNLTYTIKAIKVGKRLPFEAIFPITNLHDFIKFLERKNIISNSKTLIESLKGNPCKTFYDEQGNYQTENNEKTFTFPSLMKTIEADIDVTSYLLALYYTNTQNGKLSLFSIFTFENVYNSINQNVMKLNYSFKEIFSPEEETSENWKRIKSWSTPVKEYKATKKIRFVLK